MAVSSTSYKVQSIKDHFPDCTGEVDYFPKFIDVEI